jgi:ribulose-phosphate 3-epimerase
VESGDVTLARGPHATPVSAPLASGNQMATPTPWQSWIRETEVEPSLYAADFANLGAQISSLLDAGARVFHFDVGDGRFVEPVTMGPIVLESIGPLIHERGGFVDCHLMVADPEHHIPQLGAAGGDSVTFHVEASDDPGRAIAAARALDLGVGVALNPETPLEQVVEAAEGADFVLCMSIHPGYSGQRFMPEALERIATLRERLPDEVLIQVDGGIDEANAAAVAKAGAQLVVAGSAIFDRPDIATAFRRLSDDVDSARSQRR